MSSDPKEFANTAAEALRAYAGQISGSYWYIPDPEDRNGGTAELGVKQAEEILKGLPIIASFLETIFEEATQ